jgi:hypothetical protein
MGEGVQLATPSHFLAAVAHPDHRRKSFAANDLCVAFCTADLSPRKLWVLHISRLLISFREMASVSAHLAPRHVASSRPAPAASQLCMCRHAYTNDNSYYIRKTGCVKRRRGFRSVRRVTLGPTTTCERVVLWPPAAECGHKQYDRLVVGLAQRGWEKAADERLRLTARRLLAANLIRIHGNCCRDVGRSGIAGWP